MLLDIRTIVVMLAFTSVLMSVTLAVGIRSGRGGGYARWSLGLGLISLGWLLAAARDTLPDYLTFAVADALLFAGICLFLFAVLEFGGATVPRWLLFAPGPALFALTLTMMGDYVLLVAAVSLCLSVTTASTVAATLRLGARGGAARWMLAGTFALGAIVIALRAVLMFLEPTKYSDIYSGSLVHTGTYGAMLLMIVAGSVAFLLMHRERYETEIQHLAMFDPLTELLNRRAFIGLAERELARSVRARAPFAILMMDLDHFKIVNDEFGHQAGDRVLAEFSAIARRSVRAEDFVGRYGGEEFCVVVSGAGMEKALTVANRIRIAASASPLGGLSRPITVSIGAAVCVPDRACTVDAVIARADDALYRAKDAGRNRVVGLELTSSN